MVAARMPEAGSQAGSKYETIHGKMKTEAKTDMKVKPGFILRQVVGEYMLMPTDDNIGVFKGAVLLNSTSAFIWEKMRENISRDDLADTGRRSCGDDVSFFKRHDLLCTQKAQYKSQYPGSGHRRPVP